MKKLKLVFLLCTLSSLVLFGCGKKEEVPEETTEVVNDIEVSVDKTETLPNNKTEAEILFDEQVATLNDYYYYYGALDSNSIKVKKAYTEEEISEQFLLDVVLANYTEKKSLVENFEKINPEEVISYKNGIPSVSYDGEFIGFLSLDATFQEIINDQTTPLNQWYLIQSIADIFCKNLECEKIQITSGGLPLHTIYEDYTTEQFIPFSLLVYENLDVINEEEIEISKLIEHYNISGANITQADYYDIINGTGSIENLEPIEGADEGSEESTETEEGTEIISEESTEETSTEIEVIGEGDLNE